MQYYAVLDTNVLVSAMLRFSSVPGQITYEALGGNIIPMLCDEIVAEYKEVLSRPKFKFDPKKVQFLSKELLKEGYLLMRVQSMSLFQTPKILFFMKL